MLHAPKVGLSDVHQAIRWTLLSAYSRDTLVTLRDAKRLYTGERPIPHDRFEHALQVMTERGEVRHFRKKLGTPGRPTVFLLPANHYKMVMDGDGNLRLAPGDEPAETPPSYAELKEISPEFSVAIPENQTPEAEPVTASKSAISPPLSVSPTPESPPAPEHEAATEEELAEETRSEAEQPSPEPAQTPVSSPEPEAPPEAETPEAHTREAAFAIMRALARRSVKERDGMGVTSAELTWTLTKKGFSESEANEHFSALAGATPDAYMEGGLRMIPPSSPGNNTDRPRYFVRTPAQAVDREQAEYEVKKRDALAAQYAAKKAKEA